MEHTAFLHDHHRRLTAVATDKERVAGKTPFSFAAYAAKLTGFLDSGTAWL
jgi:hypothetical protein